MMIEEGGVPADMVPGRACCMDHAAIDWGGNSPGASA